jgi:autotransporter-associated beta strand protein
MCWSRTITGLLLLGWLSVAWPAFAGYTPTNQEQYMLEVVNRARLNPDGEVYRLRNQTWGDTGSPRRADLNEGITSSFLTHEPRQPLAFNDTIIQAARNYSQTLLNNNAFQHDFGGTDPGSRMTAAGYSFSGSWSWGENLALTYASYPLSIDAGMVDSQYNGLFIDGNVSGRGHRRNLLNGSMKEVGIGIVNSTSASYTPPGGSGKWYAVITTQDFAYSTGSSSGKAFLTGVVYNDAVTDNNFYDPGEGLGSATVAATPVGGGTASTVSTWSSGGYSLPLAPGTYNVTFSGGGLASSITYANVTIGSTNVKLDASSDLGVWNADASGNWSTSGSWSGVAPSGSGKAAIFAAKATAARTISLTSPQTVGSLSFNNATAGYAISGSSTLTMQLAGDRARAFVYAGSHSMSTPISLASGLDVTVLSATDSLTFSGPISNPTAQSIVKLGMGTLVLSGSNSYTGGTVVSGGRLVVTTPNALLNGSSLTVGTAAAFAAPMVVDDVAGSSASSATAVAEPGSAALLAVGAMFLAMGCKRRRR